MLRKLSRSEPSRLSIVNSVVRDEENNEEHLNRENHANKEAYIIKYTRLYKGIFSVLLITLIITIFELVFYIYLVYPTILDAIKQISPTTVNSTFLNILNKREHFYINKLRMCTYYIIIAEIITIFCLMCYVYARIYYAKALYSRHIHAWSEGLSNDINIVYFKDVIIASSLTIFLLVCFQVFFFFFGINFQYMGTYGKDEIIYRFFNNLGFY